MTERDKQDVVEEAKKVRERESHGLAELRQNLLEVRDKLYEKAGISKEDKIKNESLDNEILDMLKKCKEFLFRVNDPATASANLAKEIEQLLQKNTEV